MAWKKSQRKPALPECLKIRQHLGGFSGSGTSHFGQLRTIADSFLLYNLILAGIAQR
jgi:hypothetical protein